MHCLENSNYPKNAINIGQSGVICKLLVGYIDSITDKGEMIFISISQCPQ